MSRISLNPCGKLNTTTGKNLYFNVLRDWEDGESFSLCRFVGWEDQGKNKQILLGSFGGVGEVGTVVDLHHGQTNKYMGTVEIVQAFGGGAEALAEIKKVVGNSVRFATLD